VRRTTLIRYNFQIVSRSSTSTQSTHDIRTVTSAELRRLIPHLAAILVDCVDGGASVSFMSPFTQPEAEVFFAQMADSADRGERLVIAAFDPETNTPVGTVQLVLNTPPNQPHRGEVAKLLVHRSARGHGLASQLMTAVETAARIHKRTLLVLDTVTGSVAERLYTNLGWKPVGSIPNYALMPDGKPCATTVFYKILTPLHSPWAPALQK